MKAPPMPIVADKMPITKPIIIGGIILMNNLDLKNLVAKDVDDYQKKVIEISNSNKFLQEIRNELRGRMKNSFLCDGKSFANEIEEIYRHIWRQKN